MGDDAGAAARRPGLRFERQTHAGLGGELWRRLVARYGGLRPCHGVRRTVAAARRGVGLLGVGIETTFLRGTLDRLGVEPQFEQRHEYKNAADVLLHTEYTPAHREALERLAESVFSDAVKIIADARGLDHDPGTRVDQSLGRVPQPKRRRSAWSIGWATAIRCTEMRARTGDKSQLLFADRWRPRRKLAPPPHRRSQLLSSTSVAPS